MRYLQTGPQIFYLLLVSALLVSCAVAPTASEEQDAAAEKFQPMPGFGNLYIVRELTFIGSAVTLRVDVEGQYIGSIVPGTYHLLELRPGQYAVSVTAKGGEDHEVVQVEQGENYFIQVEPAFSWRPTATVDRIDEAQGRKLVIKGKRLDTIPLKQQEIDARKPSTFAFPGMTVASDGIKRDILQFIYILVLASDCQSFKLVDTRIVGFEGEFTVDERKRLLGGEVNEIWTVEQCGANKDYYINMTPDGQGGTHVKLSETPFKLWPL